MKKSRLLSAVCAGVLVLITTTTNAAVLPLERRLEGLAYYDPNLDITWATDSTISGTGNWEPQNTWAATLTLGGVSGWRLAGIDEYDYLYWERGVTADHLTTPHPIFGRVERWYWANEGNTQTAWFYEFIDGFSDFGGAGGALYAWAVYDGDVSPVPTPPSVWLFGSGLLGLIGIAKRKSAGGK